MGIVTTSYLNQQPASAEISLSPPAIEQCDYLKLGTIWPQDMF